MKKRILCLILTALMLIACFPLSVLADGVEAISDAINSIGGPPIVKVTSLYFYNGERPSEYRALPDEEGNFYFDISLNKEPADGGDIWVYYRTVDDSAVAKWGDYESVGTVEDAYVTLNKANGYKSRVVVKSTVIGDGFVAPTADGTGPDKNRLITRRFIFDLIRVEGNAELHEPQTSSERNESELYCYLRADRYHYQLNNAHIYTPLLDTVSAQKQYWYKVIEGTYGKGAWESMPSLLARYIFDYFESKLPYYTLYQTTDPSTWINIPRIKYKGGHSAMLNFTFDDTWKNYAQSGICNVGISIVGQIIGEDRDSDGNATFTLYYDYQGKRMPAVTLYLEGEFDDSKHFGWEHAFEYAVDGSDMWQNHMEDNFVGFTIYDNYGNVEYEIIDDMPDPENRGSLGIIDLCNKLKQAVIDGYVVKQADPDAVNNELVNSYQNASDLFLYYMKLPSNFVLADSYYYEFYSDSSNTKEIRRVENGAISFALISNNRPMFAKDDNGVNMISANVNELREGDPLRMSIRFGSPVYVSDPQNSYITLSVNGTHTVKLYLKQLDHTTESGEYQYYASDTLVFEGDISSIKDIKIESLRNIKLSDGSDVGGEGIKSFLTNYSIISKTISDIYGYSKDMRVPVAAVSSSGTENWSKSKSLDISVNIGTGTARFTDYVTVYYQWSTSPARPETYSSKITFHSAKDKETIKTIIGTGNGMMYLHLKSVSSYGKTSVSDSVTGMFNTETYTPFGPFKFDNAPPVLLPSDVSFIDSGSMKKRTIEVNMPSDNSGLQYMSLYYIPKNNQTGDGKLIKTFESNEFLGNPAKLRYSITNETVGVGVARDENGVLIPERRDITFYWVISDVLGNTTGKTGEFVMAFDTNEYLDVNTYEAGPYGEFISKTETLEGETLSYIYDYGFDKNQIAGEYGFGFAFTLKSELDGTYGVKITDKDGDLDSTKYEYTEMDENGLIKVWFKKPLVSGKYQLMLYRVESGSIRYSTPYTVYLTNGEKDKTETAKKVESGTLLINTVFQLPQNYQYIYKNSEGTIVSESYNGEKLPATFSSVAKAKEYVLFCEYADICLYQIPSAAIADAINNGSPGYLKADGESEDAKVGQYWIRYKSRTWTPTSGDSAWVYYYYGSSKLSSDSLSSNILSALNDVANRIVNYGKEIVLTDTSLFFGYTAVTNKMLDSNGMPYLSEGQIHNADEASIATKCGNEWNVPIAFAADKNIYRSIFEVGDDANGTLKQYPLVGNFALFEGSLYQYMTLDEYEAIEEKQEGYRNIKWKHLITGNEKSFYQLFSGSGIYYIREISVDGVSVYPICVDKEAPEVTFNQKTSETGALKKVVYNGKDKLNITAIQVFIESFSVSEYDDLAYVAVYKASDLSTVGVYIATELADGPIKLPDGNFYIVVADRSGNSYTLNARISSSDFDCQIRETTDKFIKLTCNRKNDEILRYEVYLNGELVTSTYLAEQNFDKSGQYSIYIQDIYGNVFSQDYQFKRNYPTVTWRYLGADGKFYNYDPPKSNANGFIMTSVSDNQHKISTSVKTRFAFSESYEFQFIGAEPQHVVSSGAETVVTIEAGQSFTLKVSYKNHSDCYTIYSGVVDVTPPSINVLAEVDMLRNGENALFDEWIKNGAVSLDKIYYVLSEIGRVTLANGDTVSSDIIKINASDANGLAYLEIYLNGTLLKRQDAASGFSQIILSRWGSYHIVAMDTVGNVAEFTFTNGMPSDVSYFVDGIEKEIELHGYLNFDENNNYTKVDYGKSEFRLDIKKPADVFMSIGISGGNTVIYGFEIEDGRIYPLTYTLKTFVHQNGEQSGGYTETTVDVSVGAALLDANVAGFVFGKEYKIVDNGAYVIYASVSADKTVTFKVYASEDASKVVSVNARVEFVGSNILFFSSEISKKLPVITFEELDTRLGTDIRINVGFTVDTDALEGERISEIKLYYSKLNDLDVNNLAGKTDIYVAGKRYTNEGFYVFVIKNLYGNETVYRISVSRTFGITASVTFGDGHKIYYSKDYVEDLYSNSEIVIDILDEDVTCEVTLNGSVYNGFVRRSENGIIYLVFSEEGSYEVVLTDSYGNTVKRSLYIDKSTCTLAEGLLTGYNEKALRRDEGYTNQKLSVDKNVLESTGIYYLAIRYGGIDKVLFDAFSETSVETSAQELVNIIGAQGDGVYTVICRNRYGSVVTKDIHYRSTPTLKLERATRSQSSLEVYSLDYACTLGFWSNNSLVFSTDASVYLFTVNGSVTECPRTLVFDSVGDYGSAEFTVTYIDEYGFEYSFNAYLVRKDVDINVPSSITGIEIDGILNTKNDISITFGENAYATYTRNNGEAVVYHSGDVLKKDGIYRFTVMDYAGNASTYTVKKDTAVEFVFVEDKTEGAITNGGIVNSSKVKLNALNKDSIYIEKVLKDGVVQTLGESFEFSEDGKWEIILGDKLGNKAYFSFNIVTKAKNGFSYTTPYEYVITELWYDSGDGVKLSQMTFVTHSEHTSSFEFIENGKYSVVMVSEITGRALSFEFKVNTTAPDVSLVGCNEGETTINDVTVTGCKVGDRIKLYKSTDTGEKLVEVIDVTSLSMKMPTVTEGGKYRIVVESEAGVATELTFVRKHVMNTAGSVFIMTVIGFAVVGLFAGLVYRNKSKTDD